MNFRFRAGPFAALDRLDWGWYHQPDRCYLPLMCGFFDPFPVLLIHADVLVDRFFVSFSPVLSSESSFIWDVSGFRRRFSEAETLLAQRIPGLGCCG